MSDTKSPSTGETGGVEAPLAVREEQVKLRIQKGIPTRRSGRMEVLDRVIARRRKRVSIASQAKQKYAEYIDTIVDPGALQAEVDRLKFQAKMRKWEAHFAKHAIELKENYFDWYITLDYENGNYTTGPTRAASKAAFEEKFGARDRAYTGHIGTA
jgi:hypothetical protein